MVCALLCLQRMYLMGKLPERWVKFLVRCILPVHQSSSFWLRLNSFRHSDCGCTCCIHIGPYAGTYTCQKSCSKCRALFCFQKVHGHAINVCLNLPPER